MLLQKMKTSPVRQAKLGAMLPAKSGDKVRFTYNWLPREGYIDYIWKWHPTMVGCFMTVNFRDGMEDVEDSSYKNFSLNQVEDFEIIEIGE